MITLVYAYYRNPDMLAYQLETWASYPQRIKEQVRAIVVDDGSPEPAVIDTDPGFEVRLYRILEDKPWNWSGARNLAMSQFQGWALMTDMDHVLKPMQAEKMLAMKLSPGNAYKPQRTKRGKPWKRHINSWLLHTNDFWACGGHDEDFAGHYGSGTPFDRNLRAVCRVRDTNRFSLKLVDAAGIHDCKTHDYGRFGSSHDSRLVPHLKAKRDGPAYVSQYPIRFQWERVQ